MDHNERGASDSGLIRSRRVKTSRAGRIVNYTKNERTLSVQLIMTMDTYPSHESSGVVPMDRTLSRHPDPCDIALSTQENRVYQGLRLVQVIKQENGGGCETKEDGQVIGRKVL